MSNFKKGALIATIVIVAVGALALAFEYRFKIASTVDVPLVLGNVNSFPENVNTQPTEVVPFEPVAFGKDVAYAPPSVKISPELSKDFNLSEIKNLADMEKAYGIKFSSADLKLLADRKFLIKDLKDTSITPQPVNRYGYDREFVDLYNSVSGSSDYKERKPQNAVFYTSDVFTNAYNNLYTELMKEMENKVFYPGMKDLSEKFFKAASAHISSAASQDEKDKWTKVRNYFAVPYAIFSQAAQPLGAISYMDEDGGLADPGKVQADYQKKDATVDTYENAAAFVKKLGLDAVSEEAVLTDLKNAYEAKIDNAPEVFKAEYIDYADKSGVNFKVDFTQFTPRGAYTSSSLRRAYFRGMKWYIMLPFFIKSPALTQYAFAISQLLAENPENAKLYDKLESTIDFMVGSSDDLLPADYLKALEEAKGKPDQEVVIMDYLAKARNPKIKDLPAYYGSVGQEQTSEVLLATKGLRFFSGKFIVDSYWTGQLTQGDEAPKPGYDQKLPPMASSLEVMSILGSDYAKSQIPKLDFYKPSTSRAIDKAVKDLTEETAKLTDADWMKNLYTGWLWTIKGLFSWQKDNAKSLPRFMQSEAWQAKVLQAASGFWTELRHATILYAKQSFAELGAGGPGCDPRKVPEAPKGYVEPQLEAYARLSYLAKKTEAGLKQQDFKLNNFGPLENFISLMDKVMGYAEKELAYAKLGENVVSSTGPDPDEAGKSCTQYSIDGSSDWEAIRRGIMDGLSASLPVPTEGPILFDKDKRAAIVADVHTGGDRENPRKILYEGTGVPYAIFTAVKDANGSRLTVGFTYSHYEFMKEFGGQRMTDEDWQKNFYKQNDRGNAFDYVDKNMKPAVNNWYRILFSK